MFQIFTMFLALQSPLIETAPQPRQIIESGVIDNLDYNHGKFTLTFIKNNLPYHIDVLGGPYPLCIDGDIGNDDFDFSKEKGKRFKLYFYGPSGEKGFQAIYLEVLDRELEVAPQPRQSR